MPTPRRRGVAESPRQKFALQPPEERGKAPVDRLRPDALSGRDLGDGRASGKALGQELAVVRGQGPDDAAERA